MNRPIVLAAACASLVGGVAPASAGQAGANWMPADQVIVKLRQTGYTQVDKIEADDGRWEGEGVKNGQRMEFHADPSTGAILTERPDKD
ncbi:Peptidase propeptide and YPEB domain-containing protein [Rhodoblastus acidophilus]|uniref:Peptidase propeptide and YPEB domain-containing protein n=1 Tax=Rhodoblastus acidophilus TaxID=1074 RepID=A0A212Q329_RHOAC|nr:PepSY domain-containing protein [Rhodoblastus acidophilus]PPQ37167.1 PepSY domain-containing protein [Rhodoblastus acidophilus]RAI18124.1 PepSY domain-containing protein [Rhodoblastus acidophilus]SNB53719.1 Peptidase propeptide and YPEB domain-containing protein [Rhodoblastus acidophilus]